ncbi:hypothetical protein C8034_v006350 [Colletotrichum sidae]|uniref:Uncharacterized protein n=1 Tax=Colletotrichum sidae TaxID=1347389 RepID=A0A4R8TSN8_9PEZI|nr:hypothetical protein C8034_v006350 [Colletotrichum sidae]
MRTPQLLAICALLSATSALPSTEPLSGNRTLSGDFDIHNTTAETPNTYNTTAVNLERRGEISNTTVESPDVHNTTTGVGLERREEIRRNTTADGLERRQDVSIRGKTWPQVRDTDVCGSLPLLPKVMPGST